MRDLTQGQDWFVILSVERANYDTHTNGKKIMAFAKDAIAKGIPFKPVVGYYEGAFEVSYVVPLDMAHQLHEHYADQNALLVLSPDVGNGRLAYLTNAGFDGVSHAGKFVAINMSDALSRDAYTYDGNTSTYFGINGPADTVSDVPEEIITAFRAVKAAQRMIDREV